MSLHYEIMFYIHVSLFYNYIFFLCSYICQFCFFSLYLKYILVWYQCITMLYLISQKSINIFFSLPLSVSTFRTNWPQNNITQQLDYSLYTKLFVLYFRVAFYYSGFCFLWCDTMVNLISRYVYCCFRGNYWLHLPSD